MTPRFEADKEIQIKKTVCWPSPGCSGCGLLVQVKNNKIVGMRGNPQAPSQGFVCKERFPHIVKWLEHPCQLKYPLKRVGERGDNRWERVTWEQALDDISTVIMQITKQYGAESLAFTEGTYRADVYGIRGRFTNLLSNPANIGCTGSACFCNRVALNYALGGAPDGEGAGVSTEVLNKSKCLVFSGINVSGSYPRSWTYIKKRLSQEPRPKVIAIDPRRTKIVDEADLWLQIRPGTDTALMLAWLYIIIGENLYDKEFVKDWTFGFEQLKERVSEYTPEKVAEITWIPVEKIRESARIYATHKPSSIIVGLATDEFGLNGLRFEQARRCLSAVTGNMAALKSERPQGPGPIIKGQIGIRDAILQLEGKCPLQQRNKQVGSDRFKIMAWPAYEITNKLYNEVYGIPQCMSGHNFLAHQPSIWRAILTEKPYPIKAMITWTSNPLLNAANTKIVYKALKSSNLNLHVVLEHFMTPTALLADYVLPVASKLEKPMCSSVSDYGTEFQCGERAIEPLGERRPDYDFFRDLAIRLGLGEYFPWQTEEKFHEYRLKPLGISFKEAATERYSIHSDEPWTYETINPKTGKPTGFATPSGKFELYSNILKNLGYDPLPFYEEPPESPLRTPQLFKDYPLILITGGRWLPQYHSEFRQVGMGTREQHPYPLTEIHPQTAECLGIRDGDWIYIETLRGVIKQKAKLTTGIDPRVVNVQHGWWYPEQPAQEPWLHGLWESNVNVLTIDDPDMCDRLGGGSAYRALLCKVYKVQTL
jgi:thiosulfate reductase/polysulfide reductase chain A